MKPLIVIKQINKAIDIVQEELEDCKKNNDRGRFDLYMSALERMKVSLHEAIAFITMTVPK